MEDHGQYWVENDFKNIRSLRTVDELLMATQDLMISERVTQAEIDTGLKVVQERLRALPKESWWS